MKRLFLVLGILTLAGLSFASKKTVFNYKFPAFAAVFTNVDTVEFFTGSGTAGTLFDNGGYYEASKTGVVECIEDNADASNSNWNLPTAYQLSGSSSDSLKCDFYPNNVGTNSSFSVTGYTGLNPGASSDSDATDGELLVITNSSTFSVTSSVTSGNAPTAMTIKAFPGYKASDHKIYGKNGSTVTAQDVTSFSASEAHAFDTNYSFAKVIPLVFFAEVDVLNTSEISTAESFTITWEGSAP